MKNKMVESKRCSRCRKSNVSFSKDSSHKDGLRSCCKSCEKMDSHQRYERNRENIIKRVNNYEKKNPTLVKASRKKYYLKNKEKILQKVREYRVANKDKIKDYLNKNKTILKEKRAHYLLEYREKNRNKLIQKQRYYTVKNKDKKKEYDQTYRIDNKNKIRGYLKEYYKNNNHTLKERSRRCGKIISESVTDSYVCKILRGVNKISNPEPWLIEAKRQQILLNRKIKHNQMEVLS